MDGINVKSFYRYALADGTEVVPSLTLGPIPLELVFVHFYKTTEEDIIHPCVHITLDDCHSEEYIDAKNKGIVVGD